MLYTAFASLTQGLCRKSLCFALRRPVEEGDKLVDDGRSVRLWRNIRGDQALGLDADGGVGAEGGFELGFASVDLPKSLGWDEITEIILQLRTPLYDRSRPLFQLVTCSFEEWSAGLHMEVLA